MERVSIQDRPRFEETTRGVRKYQCPVTKEWDVGVLQIEVLRKFNEVAAYGGQIEGAKERADVHGSIYRSDPQRLRRW